MNSLLQRDPADSVVIVDAVRTPIGTFMGELSALPAYRLGSVAIRALLQRTGVAGDQIGEVIMGNIVGTEPRGNPAREALLDAGLPISIPAFTVNKNCASGLKSIALGANAILAGEYDACIGGGMESMSRIPHIMRGMRAGVRMGDAVIEDLLLELLEGMGLTAERLASDYKISREAQDAFALRSQMRAAESIRMGRFRDEIVPIAVTLKRKEVVVDSDLGVKSETTMQGLSALKPVFQTDGCVTAGNSSTINDAGAALLLMRESTARELNLNPLARI
ncbi:MAG: thiolase family protein, partial [Bacillota bacterium]|nr:thiolase family protein [Bacillota bacterium]